MQRKRVSADALRKKTYRRSYEKVFKTNDLDKFVEYLKEQIDDEHWWFDDWLDDQLKEYKVGEQGK